MSHPSSRFKTFSDFYPYYLQEHADPRCRALHYIGTLLSIFALSLAFFIHPLWLVAVPLSGYGFAWAAHGFIEKNKPATFTYPLWSLRGDYKMLWSWMTGKLPAQLRAAGIVP